MSDATVFATFVVVFREALEASLIIGIILTVLAHSKAHHYFSTVILSSAAALVSSFIIGNALSLMADATQDKVKETIEGVISLVACGVLTYMFFWMEAQARQIKSSLQAKVELALSTKDYFAMAALSFFAVFREGAETVLFLKAVAIQSDHSVSLAGALWGCGLAVLIVALIFIGGKKIPLKPLFRGTGFFILLMASGLLAYGVHELEEVGWIPPIIYPVYNINSILNEKEGLGSFLKALFGYNGNPSLTELAAYWTYLVVIFGVFVKKERTSV